MVLNIPDIPDGWKYVVSSLVGGGIAIFVTIVNNRHQLIKDAQQWEREKLWDGYQRCTSSLILMESLWTDILSPKKMELWRVLKGFQEERVEDYGRLVLPLKGEERMKALKEIQESIKETEEQIKAITNQIKEMAEQILSIYSEMYPYLYWIIYNYPDPVLKEIIILKESIEQKQITEINISLIIDERKLALMPPIFAVQSMKQELIQLMNNDPRLLKK